MLFIAGHANAYQVAMVEAPDTLYLSEKVTETITDESYTITDSQTPNLKLPLPYEELHDTDAHLRQAFYLLDQDFANTKGV